MATKRSKEHTTSATSKEIALQHTRCWLAVTAIHANLERFLSTGTGELERQIGKINRWLAECENDIRKKKISAAANRAIYAACGRMGETMTAETASKDNGEALFSRWCASIWASLTLLEDCRNCCPTWFRGRHWHYLLQTTTTLAEAIAKICPSAEDEGTTIYEEVAL